MSMMPSTLVQEVVRLDQQLRDAVKRLNRIAEIVENVDARCMHADGDVTPTLEEMTQEEISEIYRLASPKVYRRK